MHFKLKRSRDKSSPTPNELPGGNNPRDVVIVRFGNAILSLESPAKLFRPPSFEGGPFDAMSDERRIGLYLEGQGVYASIDRTLGRVGQTRGFLYRTYKGSVDTWPKAHDILNETPGNDREIIELVIRAFMR